mgnify:CR=1 FL=1|jgi:hypothetical protein
MSSEESGTPDGEPMTVEGDDAETGLGAVVVTLGAILAFLLFGNQGN